MQFDTFSFFSWQLIEKPCNVVENIGSCVDAGVS